jgi:foldase protein PrsA
MKKPFLFAVVAALLAAALFVLWQKGVILRPDPGKRVVATVNGRDITFREFSLRFAPFLASLKLSPGDRRPVATLGARYLAKLADTELLRQEAASRGILVTPEEIEKELAPLCQDLAGADDPASAAGRDEAQQREKLSQWKADLADRLLLAKLTEAVAGTVSVTDDEVKAYYTANPAEFNRPPMARARQIVTSTEAEARAIRQRALNGEEFAALAAASIAPEGAKGGDLGLFAQGEMPEEIDLAVFILPAGAVSQVIKSPYGYHVIRVEERLPARTLTLADATGEIRARLAAARREEAFARWLPAARAGAKITLFPERLEEPAPDESR